MLANKFISFGKIALVSGIILTANSWFESTTQSWGLSASKAVASEYSNNSDITSSEQEIESIESLLDANIQAYQEEDLDRVMNTMHPNSPSNSEVKQISEYAFEYYDISYEKNSFEVVSLSDSDAIVRITQTARTMQSSDFKNNRTTSLQTLKKYNGQWKFFGFIGVENVEYLN